MGLDLYVGPFTRYYTGNWKTIVQQAAEAQGLKFEVIRPPGAAGPEDAAPPNEARQAILTWREALVRGGGGLLPSLDWEELPQADYYTDKPDWDGYFALRYLAARDEFADVPAPREVPLPSKMSDPERVPAMQRVAQVYSGKPAASGIGRLFGRKAEPASPPRYPHLHLAECWLPADFASTFTAPDVAGNQMTFGSVPRLQQELQALNTRTLRGSAADMEAWRQAGPPGEEDRALEVVARFAMSVYTACVDYATEHRLPIKMDY